MQFRHCLDRDLHGNQAVRDARREAARSRLVASPFSGARFGGRPVFIEEPSSSRHGL